MNGKSATAFWRNVSFVSFILTALTGWEILQFVLSRPIALFASKWTVLLFGLLVIALLALTLFILTFDRARWEAISKFLNGPETASKPLRALAFCIFIILLPVYTIAAILLAQPLTDIQDPLFTILTRGWQLITYLPTGWPDLGVRPAVITNFVLRLWLFWMIGLLAALIIRRGRKGLSLGRALALAMLFQAVVYEICAYAFQVSTFPFSLEGWSESSRFYYASLLFSKSLYGSSLPLSIWHPTRYFLQFLFSSPACRSPCTAPGRLSSSSARLRRPPSCWRAACASPTAGSAGWSRRGHSSSCFKAASTITFWFV
jgi:hypothetical protein